MVAAARAVTWHVWLVCSKLHTMRTPYGYPIALPPLEEHLDASLRETTPAPAPLDSHVCHRFMPESWWQRFRIYWRTRLAWWSNRDANVLFRTLRFTESDRFFGNYVRVMEFPVRDTDPTVPYRINLRTFACGKHGRAVHEVSFDTALFSRDSVKMVCSPNGTPCLLVEVPWAYREPRWARHRPFRVTRGLELRPLLPIHTRKLASGLTEVRDAVSLRKGELTHRYEKGLWDRADAWSVDLDTFLSPYRDAARSALSPFTTQLGTETYPIMEFLFGETQKRILELLAWELACTDMEMGDGPMDEAYTYYSMVAQAAADLAQPYLASIADVDMSVRQFYTRINLYVHLWKLVAHSLGVVREKTLFSGQTWDRALARLQQCPHPLSTTTRFS